MHEKNPNTDIRCRVSSCTYHCGDPRLLARCTPFRSNPARTAVPVRRAMRACAEATATSERQSRRRASPRRRRSLSQLRTDEIAHDGARQHQPRCRRHKGNGGRGARAVRGRERRLVGEDHLQMVDARAFSVPGRITRASGQTLVFAMSQTRKREGSSLLPAPMALMMGTPAAVASSMSKSLTSPCRWRRLHSHRRSDRSARHSARRKMPALPAHPRPGGWTAPARAWPPPWQATVSRVAMIWRLRFVSSTQSASTNVKCPTPARKSASARCLPRRPGQRRSPVRFRVFPGLPRRSAAACAQTCPYACSFIARIAAR